MNHPCNHYSCCENLHGECYGGGCKLNPTPAPSEPEDGEDESINQQPNTKEKNTHEHQ